MNTTCSCGKAGPHVVMKRVSADGIHVYMWDDGAITGALGVGLRGIVMARPKTDEARARELRAGRRFMEWVSCYDVAELGPVLAKERKKEKH